MKAGEQLGAWTLSRPIGAGGMGRVWVARHVETQEWGAIKILRGDADPDEEERFAREIDVLASLRHPAIVRLLDHGVEAGNPYLVMQYAPGETLEARLARAAPVPLTDALPMFAALADGLRHAHELGIHHRDIKAENVIIGADGWGTLVDFGVALKHGASRLTTAGFVMGTFAYLPPEVVGGGERDPVLADVYALAQLLCEALTGVPLFRGSAATAANARWAELVAEKVAAGPLDPGDAFPEPLRELVRRATAPEPEDRTATAGELADGLRALLNWRQDEALEARLGETWGPVRSASARAPQRPAPLPRRQGVPIWALGLAGVGIGLCAGSAVVVIAGSAVVAAVLLR